MSATAVSTEKQAPLTSLPAWKALQAHYEKIRNQHLRDLFRNDPGRGTRLTAEAEGIYLDYSKHRITDETLKLLLELAEQSGLRERIEAMFTGEKINITEKRAVLHTALRAPRDAVILVDGENVVPEVHEVLDRMSGLFQPRAQRRLEGLHRQAHPERHQHRHRRLRSGPGDGL